TIAWDNFAILIDKAQDNPEDAPNIADSVSSIREILDNKIPGDYAKLVLAILSETMHNAISGANIVKLYERNIDVEELLKLITIRVENLDASSNYYSILSDILTKRMRGINNN